MILLDTHIWLWWVASPEKLSTAHRKILEGTTDQLSVSLISLWEVSPLEGKRRIKLPSNLDSWFYSALDDSGIAVIELSREVIVESTRLPGAFHRDPADRIIVATARLLHAPIMTEDRKIAAYEEVDKV